MMSVVYYANVNRYSLICSSLKHTIEYMSAPMNGTNIRRNLFGHLLGFGFRHSDSGSGFWGPVARDRFPVPIRASVKNEEGKDRRGRG